jgi:hypothetical protein
MSPFIGGSSLPSATPDILLQNVVCDASVSIGDWVRLDATFIAVKAQADSLDNAHVFGLCEEKTTATAAVVRVAGVTSSLFIGLDPTKTYHLSEITAGAMDKQGINVPIVSGSVIIHLGRPLSSTRFIVNIGERILRS